MSFVSGLFHEMLRPYHGLFLSVPFSVDLNLEGLNFLASVKQIEDLQL